jgi:hypothetical protein
VTGTSRERVELWPWRRRLLLGSERREEEDDGAEGVLREGVGCYMGGWMASLQLDLDRTAVVCFRIVCPRMTSVPGAHIWARVTRAKWRAHVGTPF